MSVVERARAAARAVYISCPIEKTLKSKLKPKTKKKGIIIMPAKAASNGTRYRCGTVGTVCDGIFGRLIEIKNMNSSEYRHGKMLQLPNWYKTIDGTQKKTDTKTARACAKPEECLNLKTQTDKSAISTVPISIDAVE